MLAEVGRRPDLRLRPQPSLTVQLRVVTPHAASDELRRALGDPRVRRALLLAIDRNDLAFRALRGHGAVASHYVHPVVFGYDPTLAPRAFDPEGARALLAEAGFADGFSVELAHGSLPPEYVDAIVRGLGRIGIEVKPVRLTLGEMLRRAQRRVLEALPILPLTVRSDFLGVSQRVDVQVRYDGWMWGAGFRWQR
jgi:hypothetical protein